jgi:hypothetical protein
MKWTDFELVYLSLRKVYQLKPNLVNDKLDHIMMYQVHLTMSRIQTYNF